MSPLEELENLLLPKRYRTKIQKEVPAKWLVLRKGSYLFAAVPFSNVPEGDFASRMVKREIRKMVFSFPIIAEKGLFLLYYGDHSGWMDSKEKFTVDRTALRPVILQAVHFADFQSGESYNRRTSWGPLKFGFCGETIKVLEEHLASKGANKKR